MVEKWSLCIYHFEHIIHHMLQLCSRCWSFWGRLVLLHTGSQSIIWTLTDHNCGSNDYKNGRITCSKNDIFTNMYISRKRHQWSKCFWGAEYHTRLWTCRCNYACQNRYMTNFNVLPPYLTFSLCLLYLLWYVSVVPRSFSSQWFR